jgi:hypothetical protein
LLEEIWASREDVIEQVGFNASSLGCVDRVEELIRGLRSGLFEVLAVRVLKATNSEYLVSRFANG